MRLLLLCCACLIMASSIVQRLDWSQVHLPPLDHIVCNEVIRRHLDTCVTECYKLDSVDDQCAGRCFDDIFSDDYFWN